MKKLFITISMLLLMSITVVANAGNMDFVMRTLARLQGQWYSMDDAPRLTIKGNELTYMSRQFIIQDIDNPAGGGSNFNCDFILKTPNGKMGKSSVSVSNLGSDPKATHQHLTLDGITFKRNQQDYFESIGGIYLGMTRAKLISLYGQPDIDKGREIGYSRLGLTVRMTNNVIDGITMYSYGNRRLDRSGLSANSSPYEFQQAYGMSGLPRGLGNSIGHNEYIWLENSSVGKTVTLSMYSN